MLPAYKLHLSKFLTLSNIFLFLSTYLPQSNRLIMIKEYNQQFKQRFSSSNILATDLWFMFLFKNTQSCQKVIFWSNVTYCAAFNKCNSFFYFDCTTELCQLSVLFYYVLVTKEILWEISPINLEEILCKLSVWRLIPILRVFCAGSSE